jgi:Putative beta-barrel porin-2, OmpL-like. bbp2
MKEEFLVDSYYMYNFSGANSLTPPVGRNYDTLSNSFTVNYAKVAFEVDADPVTVRADIGYGALAYAINGPSNAFLIEQAYASLKIPTTPVTVDFGRFVTTAGAEVIEANKNWLYSRSMLFFTIPVLHTGLRVGVKVNDMVSVQGTLANGIANDSPDNNKDKTGGLSVTIAPLPTTTIVATTYFGKEGTTGGTSDPVHFTGDLVVSHNISDAFGLNLNLDYVKGSPANPNTAPPTPGVASNYVFGAALMAHYVVAEHANVSARVEYLKDKGIYLDPDGSEYEGTLGAAFPFAGHYEIRPELRGDFAKNAVYNGKKSQATGTIAVLGYL